MDYRLGFAIALPLVMLASCSSRPSPEQLCSSPDTLGGVQAIMLEDAIRLLTIADEGKPPKADMKEEVRRFVGSSKFDLPTVEKFDEAVGKAECRANLKFIGHFGSVEGGLAQALVVKGATITPRTLDFPIEYTGQVEAGGTEIVATMSDIADFTMMARKLAKDSKAENKQ